MILGIFIFLIGISVDHEKILALIGVVIAAFGITFIVNCNAKYSDRSMDEFCNIQANIYYSVKRGTVESYGLLIEDDILVSRYSFENIFAARQSRKGKDGAVRSTILDISCIFFTSNRIYYYNKKCP